MKEEGQKSSLVFILNIFSMKTFHNDENSDQFQFFGGSTKGAEVHDSFCGNNQFNKFQ